MERVLAQCAGERGHLMDICALDNFRTHVEMLCFTAGDMVREKEAARDKNSKLMFYAVRVPVLRQIMKSRFDYAEYSPVEWLQNWDWIVRHSTHYEPISLGLLFYQTPDRTKVCGFIDAATIWAEQIENWGHCDLLGSAMSAFAAHSWGTLEPFLQVWTRSEGLWLRRLSIVSLVRYVGKSSTYLPFGTVAKFIEPHLDTRDKYISRPVGWVLREHLKADPNGAPRSFLKHHWPRLACPAKTKLQLFTKLEGIK